MIGTASGAHDVIATSCGLMEQAALYPLQLVHGQNYYWTVGAHSASGLVSYTYSSAVSGLIAPGLPLCRALRQCSP